MNYGNFTSDNRAQNQILKVSVAGSFFDEQFIDSWHTLKKFKRHQSHSPYLPKGKLISMELHINLLFIISLLRIKRKIKRNHLISLFYLVIMKLITFKLNSYEVSFYDDLKLCNNKSFLSIDVIKISDRLHTYELKKTLLGGVVNKLKFNHHSVLYKYIILLSGDINLNPGPTQGYYSNNTWSPFKKRGLHFLHLNINSLLPKIDEIRFIAKKSNAAVIGITESKLDDSVLSSEISIDGYDVLRNDRTRKGGGVACYIRQDLCYIQKNVFPATIENIFIDIMLPKTKPFCVGVFYRPPNQNYFLEDIESDFPKLLKESNDIFVMGDVNINIFVDGKTIFENNKNTLSSNAPLTQMDVFN